ncbi:MAG: chloride channel protein [Hyphomicrobiaceae bacterium]|nr:chloride channel protein [Hyphomicrobiaceae bacterium]
MQTRFNQVFQIRSMILGWLRPNFESFIALQKPKLWLLAILAGVAGGIAAIAFRGVISLVQLLWTGGTSELMLDRVATLPPLIVWLAPTLGGLAVGLLLWGFGPQCRAGGVADAIEARTSNVFSLSLRRATVGTLISAITLGSGGSAGREGPIVYFAAAMSKALFRAFDMPPSARRIMLAAGVAAAISASFNSPIAGVLFAHEVILGHFAMTAFVPLVIASVVAAVMSRIWFGAAPAFTLPDFQITSYWEIPAFALLGIVCAAVAILFQAGLIGTDWASRKVSMPIWLRPTLGGAIVGLIALAFPQILGVGYEATNLALTGKLSISLMITLIVVKTIATSITLGSRLGGGVFSPSLYLGAMTGGAFGLIAAAFFPEMASSEGLYAIIGMGAVASAVLGAPVSTAVMIFELTGGFSFSLALLFTTAIATGLSQAAMGRSFFFWQLHSRGVLLEEGPHTQLARQTFVKDLMRGFSGADEKPAFDPVNNPSWLKQTDTLDTALKLFSNTDKTRLMVVAGDTNEPVGWLYHVDALANFNRALIDQSREEHH